MDVQLLEQQQEQLIHFLLLIQKWNRVYNLTAVRELDEMVGHHLLDSLSALPWLPQNKFVSEDNQKTDSTRPTQVLDVGSGAGLPVLPLAIVRPDLQFLSVESNGKKTRFQQQVVMELGLNNVRVLQERIEDTNETAHTIISRAFTSPDKFIRAIEKNCLPDSCVIIMLGQKEKMPEALSCGFVVSELMRVDVPSVAAARHVALCKLAHNATDHPT